MTKYNHLARSALELSADVGNLHLVKISRDRIDVKLKIIMKSLLSTVPCHVLFKKCYDDLTRRTWTVQCNVQYAVYSKAQC